MKIPLELLFTFYLLSEISIRRCNGVLSRKSTITQRIVSVSRTSTQPKKKNNVKLITKLEVMTLWLVSLDIDIIDMA